MLQSKVLVAGVAWVLAAHASATGSAKKAAVDPSFVRPSIHPSTGISMLSDKVISTVGHIRGSPEVSTVRDLMLGNFRSAIAVCAAFDGWAAPLDPSNTTEGARGACHGIAVNRSSPKPCLWRHGLKSPWSLLMSIQWWYFSRS